MTLQAPCTLPALTANWTCPAHGTRTLPVQAFVLWYCTQYLFLNSIFDLLDVVTQLKFLIYIVV